MDRLQILLSLWDRGIITDSVKFFRVLEDTLLPLSAAL